MKLKGSFAGRKIGEALEKSRGHSEIRVEVRPDADVEVLAFIRKIKNARKHSAKHAIQFQ